MIIITPISLSRSSSQYIYSSVITSIAPHPHSHNYNPPALKQPQRNRQQTMTNDLHPQWHNRRPIRNRPATRSINPQVDHPPDHRQHHDIHILEVLRDAINADEEPRRFEFLRRRGPLDVGADKVAEEGLGEVEGDPREEEDYERRAGYDLRDGGAEGLPVEAVADDAVCYWRLVRRRFVSCSTSAKGAMEWKGSGGLTITLNMMSMTTMIFQLVI
jgi:hypothetical protein